MRSDAVDQRKRVPTVSEVLSDGSLVELVLLENPRKTALAVFRDGSVAIEDEIAVGDGRILVPVSAGNNLIKHRALLLPGAPVPHGSTAELTCDIERYLCRYVDFSDPFYRLASAYVLLTWVYDAFNELPYLRLRGDFGSGKTRGLSVLGSICYKSFFASGASTVSPIFHTLDRFRATLILDEADFRFSDEKAELVKILNNGNVRGFPVLRTAITAKREFDPRAFSVFGPKIVAMRRSFSDPALESRFLTEEMGQRPLRRDIPINLPEVQEEEAAALRSRLLSYRFATFGRVQTNASLVDAELAPRLNQVLVPLLSVIEDEAVRQEILETARAVDRQMYEDRSSTVEADILQVLNEQMAQSSRSTVPIAELTAAFAERFGSDFERPISNRYVGGILRQRLRVVVYKSHGVAVVPTTEREKVSLLCARYGVKDDQKGRGG